MEELIGYRYAFFSNGKSSEVVFWQVNPFRGDQLERVRIRLNNVAKVNRMRYGLRMAEKINKKLDQGWNYFVEKYKARKLADCVSDYLYDVQLKRRPATYSSYKSRCNLFLKWVARSYPKLLYLHEVTPSIANQYFEWLQNSRGYSNYTYNNALVEFRVLFNYFIRKKLIGTNPFHGIDPYPEDEKFRTFIARKDLHTLFEHLKSNDPHFMIVCGLCYYGLIRRSEIIRMQMHMIDWDKRFIKISGSIAKTRKNKIVVIPDELFDLLINLNYPEYPSAYYLCSRDFKPGEEKLHAPRISERFRKVADLLKFPKDYQFYSLKDTGNTHMEESGISGPAIRDQAGWKTMQMRDTYSHTTGEALEKLRKFKID